MEELLFNSETMQIVSRPTPACGITLKIIIVSRIQLQISLIEIKILVRELDLLLEKNLAYLL